MEKFLNDLSSPYFLLVSVFLAIVINVASYYVSKRTDQFLGFLPRWWRSRRVASEARFQSMVEDFVNNPDMRVIFVGLEIRSRLRAIMQLTMAGVSFAIIPTVLGYPFYQVARSAGLLMAALMLALTISSMWRSFEYRDVCNVAALKLRSKAREPAADAP